MVDQQIQEFDFETPYQRWPMKEGKKRGMQTLQRTIKSRARYDAFVRAMDNYIDMKTKSRTKLEFWLRWHTFCNNWEDYEVPLENPSMVRNQLDRIMKGDL